MSLETEAADQTAASSSLEDDEAWRRHTATEYLGEMGLGSVITAAQRADEFSAVRD